MYIEYMKNAQNMLDERLQILLDRDTHNELKKLAIERGLKKSSLIRTILKEKFNKENGGK